MEFSMGGYEIMDEEKSVPAPCSRTALVRDRYIDEIKAEKKWKTFEKVDEVEWAKVVQRMKDKEKKRDKERK